MTLNQWYEKGLTFEQYVDQMTTNKDPMVSIFERLQLNEETQEQLKGLQNLNLRAVALTEDWCGDAMVNNPALMKIAAAAGIDVRFLLRDQNLELMDQYLTNGTARSIPIYVFLDQDGNEFAVWGPRAKEVQQFVDEQRANLPEKDAADFEEKQKEMYRGFKKKYLEDEQLWQQVVNSIIAKINK